MNLRAFRKLRRIQLASIHFEFLSSLLLCWRWLYWLSCRARKFLFTVAGWLWRFETSGAHYLWWNFHKSLFSLWCVLLYRMFFPLIYYKSNPYL